MLSRLRHRISASAERGQVIYLFALLAPLILGLGAIVLSVGNWYVHKRHLQTQVDASVLAAAPTFSSCFFDPAVANTGIISDAIPYSGDTARAAAQSSTSYNQQLQTPSHTHVIYNSGSRYWQQTDGTDPTKGGTDSTKSYGGLDNSAGAPCSVSYLEAHATDDRAPLLFPWFIAHPSPKTRARVEIREVLEKSGLLPLAVPELDPAAVFAIFVDYAKDGSQVPIATQELSKDTTYGGSGFPYSAWVTSSGQEPVTIHPNNSNSDGTGVVILVSKNSNNPSMSGTLNNICNPNPNINLVACYAGTGNGYDGAATGQGLSFIHSFATGNGSVTAPLLQDVQLTAVGCTSPGDLSAAYFTNDANDCSAAISVVADFGVSGNPQNFPTCARIPGYSWSAGGVGGSLGTWTGGTISLPAGSGHQALSLSWKSGPKTQGQPNACPNNNQGSTNQGNFPGPAAVPYVADDASDPVQYLKLTAIGPGGGPSCVGSTVADANSVARGDYCYTVAVGLDRPITLDPDPSGANTWDQPDILLRFASKAVRNAGGNKDNVPLNGALKCDQGIPLEKEFANGCQTTYGLNYRDWDKNPATPKTWLDIGCDLNKPGEYSGPLPPLAFVNTPAPICVAPKGGSVQALQAGLYDRFESPTNGYGGCTPNYWPTTQAEADTFFKPVNQGGHDFTNDPRYITLIVTDNTAFQSTNGDEPVKYFAGFYVTGWDTTRGNGNGKPNGCFGFSPNPGTCGAPNNDAHPTLGCLAGNPTTKDNGDIWGHYVKFVDFSSKATPSDTLCDLTSTSAESCVAVLTR